MAMPIYTRVCPYTLRIDTHQSNLTYLLDKHHPPVVCAVRSSPSFSYMQHHARLCGAHVHFYILLYASDIYNSRRTEHMDSLQPAIYKNTQRDTVTPTGTQTASEQTDARTPRRSCKREAESGNRDGRQHRASERCMHSTSVIKTLHPTCSVFDGTVQACTHQPA